jgi:hypothetical protein
LEGRTTTCDDYIGNYGGANGLSINHWEVAYPTFSGEFWSGSTLISKADGLPAYSMNPGSSNAQTYYGACGAVCQSNAAWEILSKANPNVPHVSVPTFLGELKDLPGLVKGWGESLLRDIAKGYLSWRWAVKPMIGDIRRLANFQEATDRRLDWLKKLRDGGGLRRKVRLSSQSGATGWSSEQTIHSNGGLVKAKWREHHSCRRWGSVRFKVAPGTSLPPTAEGLAALAKRLTFGITSHEALATLWELTPWSWFVDWFLGVGDTIAALNNTVPLTTSHLCFMRHSTVKREWQVTTLPAVWTLDRSPSGEHELKERFVVAPTLPFSLSLPLLDGGKWSILAALAALRR